MSEESICKLCGHHGDAHQFADPVRCRACPDGVCQDGPAGRRYRDRMLREAPDAA